ncbi:hypothetical protein NX722_05120 [Endozoicomonas gorgoniicola]|uniref:Ubiquitin-like protease family profile domain-containing protein n=1 Tax=Endozoicomonas gorgoniicola TaxID=1234144 RepID=A0ABT3MRN9_9GAMM|nr:hypothetical protein [Endozoicomonas gorgoniicola]MCW7552032.1 hypothetical protein [Endozoicomonas gorgoniicola]
MDAASGSAAVTRANISTEINRKEVIKNPCCLYRMVSKKTLISHLTKLPEPGYVLNRHVRDRLLDKAWFHLEVFRPTVSSNFDPDGPEPTKPNDPDDPTLELRELMKSAVYDKSDSSIGISCQTKGVSKLISCVNKTVILPDPEEMPVNTPIAIYNKDATYPFVLTGKQSSDLQPMPLKANCGTIIHVIENKNSRKWETLSSYESKSRKSPVNPILIEIPTKEEKLEKKKLKLAGKSCKKTYKGEPFLTTPMVEDLAAEATGLSKPDFYKHKKTTTDPFKKILTDKGEKTLDNGKKVVTTNLLVQSTSCEHIIHVRLIRDDDNNIFIYMHETLKPDDPVALNISDDVMNAVADMYYSYNLYLLKPGFELQKDSSGCSQLALESIIAFNETPDLDEWVIKTAKDAGALISQPKRKRREKADPASLIKDDKFYITADQMHAQLLKSNQNKALLPDSTEIPRSSAHAGQTKSKQRKADKLTDTQLDTVIDKKTGQTLRKHYQKHTVSVPDEDNPGQTSDVNLFALGSRYQNILKWEDLQQKKNHLETTKRKAKPVNTGEKTKKQKPNPLNDSLQHLRDALAVGPEISQDKLMNMAARNITEKTEALDKKEQQISQLQTQSKANPDIS